ncbi:DEAD/DEAH box helicase [Oribacterium sp. FC2011]|uniref:DEAD/DEAH box helicase n=1 Tax=Oribacterium sp. FC2011 TaxID=1408311 RepID=UPI0004E1BC07|nr:DEAD/DEAH box helicase [Oribacterium sp. FC2011]
MLNYREKIRRTIENRNDTLSLFVLKGFDMEVCGFHKANLTRVIDNKIRYFMEVAMKPEKVMSFEEFVCLYDMSLAQYKSIIILENPEFSELYPLNVNLNEDVKNSLLTSFDEDVNSTAELIDIKLMDEYLNIFSNFINTEDGIRCSYNINSEYLKNEKILRITIGEAPEKETLDIGKKYDYDEVISYPEVREYMSTYWGYDSFRDFRIYDMDALELGEKKVISISQEKIIGDMITQAEACVKGTQSRDIFVTAPTGAGKSLMFQLPAMYLADKYNLVTIVITPLIGLMNDQVQALNRKGYFAARTINSDISPIVKEEILNEVSEGRCHILYLSPESLLSRSDITQLIGSRRIGMIIVDEAHIVTTWGKQFRPDYWYLGDFISKLRAKQSKAPENPMSFVIASFTATAIYGGHEDMYTETLNSLHMIDPISYLGYLKRDNLSIEISEVEAIKKKTEYELDKFDALIEMIRTTIMRDQKTLIYFPTVALIDRFYSYCASKNLKDFVAKYHGQMSSDQKNENFQDYLTGKKLIMIATKAFGMGIDIPDIAVVSHFAPTGNVCDYMQEIGRAARDKKIEGHAIYKHMSNDFQHINRLHGLNCISKGQLVEVQRKILELFETQRYSDRKNLHCKKRNEMLIDTDSFSYIFDSPMSDDNELVNKVKTAMLLIQKDYENRGLRPFSMRPIPIFAYGFLSMEPIVQNALNHKFGGVVSLKDKALNICEVNLKKIWESSYQDKMSFPKFKYMLYSGSKDLEINKTYKFNTAMAIDINFEDGAANTFEKTFSGIKEAINTSVRNNIYTSEDDMAKILSKTSGISLFKAENIIRVVVAAVTSFGKTISKGMNSRIYEVKRLNDNTSKYLFNPASRSFLSWIEKEFKIIVSETKDGTMYVVNNDKNNKTKEILTALGILESFGVLRFKSLGGTNSQIYIYVNETKNLRIVREKPEMYKNRLLETVSERHKESVKMLSYIFQGKFKSDEVWELLENYFLGILPEELR